MNSNSSFIINLDYCYDSYPCRHLCTHILKNGIKETKVISAPEIIHLLNINKMSVPQHFSEYNTDVFKKYYKYPNIYIVPK